MIITMTRPEITDNVKSVSVTFTNDEGEVYVRSINVPYTNGEINLQLLDEYLESHLRSIEVKAKVGVIQFIKPNANTEIEVQE